MSFTYRRRARELRRWSKVSDLEMHFPRPAELADDNTPLMPVLRYVTETFQTRGQTFDEVWLLMACAPLIDVNDLRAAARLLLRTGQSKAVLAVAPFPAPIEKAFDRRMMAVLLPCHPKSLRCDHKI